MKLLCARFIAPMAGGAVLRDAALAMESGRIVAVGAKRELAGRFAGAEAIDLGDVLLTPGLVNAHTHLELSDVQRPATSGRFIDWVQQLIAARSALGSDIAPASATAAQAGAAESLRFGVTCVGDISAFPAATRPVLAQSPLRVVSFGEVRAMAARRGALPEQMKQAADATFDDWQGSARLRISVSPHAPYSAEPAAYLACLGWAKERARPITTHLAETADEVAFLAEHKGDLRALWAALGGWTEDVPRFAGGPVRFAEEVGLLDERALLAHVNYADDAELDLLKAGNASVAWCPRTHAYFGHPPHRFREMLARGINVCLGTDSRASSPDLDLLAEARLVHRDYPDVPAALIWEMITARPAAALGVAADLGALAPGRWADLVAWPLATVHDPLREVLESGSAPVRAWIGGEELPG